VTTYAELIDPKTAETLREELLDRLEQAEFPITAWQPGNPARTLVQVDVQTLAELYEIVSLIGKGWSLDDAADAWLTLHAYSRYDLERILATFAKHEVTLTAASGAGPYSITAGQLVLVNNQGVRFRSTNTTTLTLSYGSPLTLTVQAETAGQKGNSQPIGVITPALAGVTMAWSSRTLDARDQESDPELRQRCRDRWATLASGFTEEAVRYWATSAKLTDGVTSAGCTRVGFGARDGLGGYVVYVAGASGPLTTPGVTAVQTILDLKKPITDTPVVTNATQVTVTVLGSVRFFSGYNTADNRSAAAAAITAYVAGLPLGSSADPPVVDASGLSAAVYTALPGKVRDIDFSNVDVTLSLGQVAVANTASITWS
jgi:uncharacterized phage protein gp47/JayE